MFVILSQTYNISSIYNTKNFIDKTHWLLSINEIIYAWLIYSENASILIWFLNFNLISNFFIHSFNIMRLVATCMISKVICKMILLFEVLRIMFCYILNAFTTLKIISNENCDYSLYVSIYGLCFYLIYFIWLGNYYGTKYFHDEYYFCHITK